MLSGEVAASELSAADSGIRRRRSPEHVRRLILDAAAKQFGEKGFRGTTFRDIACDAGVAESQIVRHFGTKAELLGHAVREPLRRYVDEFQTMWERQLASPASSDELSHVFIAGLYDLFRENRRLFMVMVSANSFDADVLGDLDLAFGSAAREMEALQAMEIERAKLAIGPITLRTIIGMVLSMAVFDNFLYSVGEQAPTRDQAIAELSALSTHGIHRPGQQG
jgi:AcrR family transcriptional regulator